MSKIERKIRNAELEMQSKAMIQSMIFTLK